MNTNTNNIYRDVTMDNISEKNVGETVRIAGWIENIRDHGGVSFIDLRDMYGVMQVVMRDTSLLEGLNKEDCISVEGPIEHRDEETYNPKIPTGTIELEAKSVDILGKVYNARWVLERAVRDHSMQIDAEAVKTASLQLKSFLDYIQNAKSIDQLRGYEGEAASIYFGVFDELILQQKKDFIFQGRNKRPPLDNVNAMLSFVYTLLTNQITSALETVGLDPYVGYMHTDRPGRASLSLDLIEELRAVMADRFVLSLINKKIVNGKDFTRKENGAVLMDTESRKKLLSEWQNKKKEMITHPYLKEKMEWGMVPYVQAMLLARFLRGDLDGYPVFLWK